MRLCHGYQACSFEADPYALSAPSCHFHSTMKTTFACVDKSVFHAEFVDQQISTAKPSTTTKILSNVINQTNLNISESLDTSTFYWRPKENMNIEAEPLEPKPSQDDNSALFEISTEPSIYQVALILFLSWKALLDMLIKIFL